MASVLVTGANRGIGLEFVRQYAADGARVFACARKPDAADALKGLAQRSDGRISLHALDVTDVAQIATLAHELRDTGLDILINNAGIDGTMSRGVIDDEAWEEVFRVNTIAPFLIARAFHGHLKRATGAKLVSMSSRLASIALSTGYALDYGASKAALNYAMHSLALQWKSDRITVVVMSPGWVKTDMGGDNAPLTTEQSVSAMRKVIGGLTPAQTGQYLSYRGEEIPW